MTAHETFSISCEDFTVTSSIFKLNTLHFNYAKHLAVFFAFLFTVAKKEIMHVYKLFITLKILKSPLVVMSHLDSRL